MLHGSTDPFTAPKAGCQEILQARPGTKFYSGLLPKAQGNQVTFLLSCANLVLKICSEAVMVFLSQTKPTTFSSLSWHVSYAWVNLNCFQFSSVQSLSCVRLLVTPWKATCQEICPSPTPGAYPNSCPLSWWCHPAISSCHPLLPPSIFPSIRVFSYESALCIRWPNYWSFSFSISPSNEYSGLISFRMDWLDLLAVQGTLKSLLQHHSSKASILWRSAFFIVQLSHPYMTTGKTIALTRQTFVNNVSAF